MDDSVEGILDFDAHVYDVFPHYHYTLLAIFLYHCV